MPGTTEIRLDCGCDHQLRVKRIGSAETSKLEGINAKYCGNRDRLIHDTVARVLRFQRTRVNLISSAN